MDAETVIDLLRSGQRSFTVADFKPNGGRQVRQSASYGKAQELCHHAIAKLYEKDGVALLPWEDLKGYEKAKFHISPLVWAPKPDTWEGRTCLNLSHKSRDFMSTNEATDIQRSDIVYKPSVFPNVHSLCEMIEKKKN